MIHVFNDSRSQYELPNSNALLVSSLTEGQRSYEASLLGERQAGEGVGNDAYRSKMYSLPTLSDTEHQHRVREHTVSVTPTDVRTFGGRFNKTPSSFAGIAVWDCALLA